MLSWYRNIEAFLYDSTFGFELLLLNWNILTRLTLWDFGVSSHMYEFPSVVANCRNFRYLSIHFSIDPRRFRTVRHMLHLTQLHVTAPKNLADSRLSKFVSMLISRSPHLKAFRVDSGSMHIEWNVLLAAANRYCSQLDTLCLNNRSETFDESIYPSPIKSLQINCPILKSELLFYLTRRRTSLQHLDLTLRECLLYQDFWQPFKDAGGLPSIQRLSLSMDLVTLEDRKKMERGAATLPPLLCANAQHVSLNYITFDDGTDLYQVLGKMHQLKSLSLNLCFGLIPEKLQEFARNCSTLRVFTFYYDPDPVFFGWYLGPTRMRQSPLLSIRDALFTASQFTNLQKLHVVPSDNERSSKAPLSDMLSAQDISCLCTLQSSRLCNFRLQYPVKRPEEYLQALLTMPSLRYLCITNTNWDETDFYLKALEHSGRSMFASLFSTTFAEETDACTTNTMMEN